MFGIDRETWLEYILWWWCLILDHMMECDVWIYYSEYTWLPQTPSYYTVHWWIIIDIPCMLVILGIYSHVQTNPFTLFLRLMVWNHCGYWLWIEDRSDISCGIQTYKWSGQGKMDGFAVFRRFSKPRKDG